MLGLLGAGVNAGRRPIALAISYSVSFRVQAGASPRRMTGALLAEAPRSALAGPCRAGSASVVRTSTDALLPFGQGDARTLSVSSLTSSSDPRSPLGFERLRVLHGTRVRSFTGSSQPGPSTPPPLHLTPVLRGFELPPTFALPPNIALLDPSEFAVKIDAFVLSVSGNDARSKMARRIADHMRQIHFEECSDYAIFERVVDGLSKGFMGISVEKVSGNLLGVLRGMVTHPDSRGLGTELLELGVSLMAGRELRTHPVDCNAAAFFAGKGFEIVPFTDEADMGLTAARSDQWSGKDNAWRWNKK